MGGSIAVQSAPGAGSAFTVQLPLALASGAALRFTQAAPSLPPLRILCVDDMPENLELLRVVLGRGTAVDTVWTCDLSHDYVTINADYRS